MSQVFARRGGITPPPSNDFLSHLRAVTTNNMTQTENGAVTYKSTLNPVLDFFALAGAKRHAPEEAVELFRLALAHDEVLAIKALFYIRDIRGGQGEREIFRQCFKVLTPSQQRRNLTHIPVYGRWDDVLMVLDDVDEAMPLIVMQLAFDLETPTPSLLAKWLPSENTSSPKTRAMARKIAAALQMDPRSYRKMLSQLRGKIRLLEQKMSANEWDDIDYSKLPSIAHAKHTKAFRRHSEERYEAYLASVAKGEAKINAGTLYPHQVARMALNGDPTAEALWGALPDYTNGKDVLVMADVSGSMTSQIGGTSVTALDVSISLAAYFAERNTGALKNQFMTFSGSPSLVSLRGTTLEARLRNISRADWEMNTDLAKAFEAIAEATLRSESKVGPETLLIVSDMEFDMCARGGTNLNNARALFAENELDFPNVVFWNVMARGNQAPALSSDQGVTLISGLSPSSVQYVMNGLTPEQFMHSVLLSERYAPIG